VLFVVVYKQVSRKLYTLQRSVSALYKITSVVIEWIELSRRSLDVTTNGTTRLAQKEPASGITANNHRYFSCRRSRVAWTCTLVDFFVFLRLLLLLLLFPLFFSTRLRLQSRVPPRGFNSRTRGHLHNDVNYFDRIYCSLA